MEIKTKFDIFETVGIVPLSGFSGRVMKIIQDGRNLWYDVVYWTEGKIFWVTLGEEDMEKIKPKHGVGMQARYDDKPF